MKLNLLFFAAFLSASNVAAQSVDIAERCLAAAIAGSADRVAYYAKVLSNLPGEAEGDLVKVGLCISAAKGELFVYDEHVRNFVPVYHYYESFARRRHDVPDGDASKLEKLLLSGRMIAEKRSTEWEAMRAAQLRTVSACFALYDRDWIAAMTSEICHPIFLETGIPDAK